MANDDLPSVATHDSPASFMRSGDADAFREYAQEGDTWFHKAQGLRQSSLLIYSHWEATGCDLQGPQINQELHEVAIMLAGEALENLLKGSIVTLDPATLTAAGIDFGKGKGAHDLVKLAGRAEVKVDDGEKRVLEYATEALMYFGRFPLPKAPRYLVGMRSKQEPQLRTMLTETLFTRFADRLFRLNWPRVQPRCNEAGPPWSTMTEDAYVAYRLHGQRPNGA